MVVTRYFSIIIFLLILSGCGEVGKKLGQKSSSPSDGESLVKSSTFTPGSYFKVMKEVGDDKDTRVYEFQYISNNRFIWTVTNFAGGNMSAPYFHKKTGTYTESNGVINHNVLTDTCNNLTPEVVSIFGDRAAKVTVNLRGSSHQLHSYANYFLPPDISYAIPDAVEDIGCSRFKDL